ncbi:ArsR family transcriptional regulator [Sulfurifustis variabilis]|uniref:ArsR family transcriptional regulator n=1 Tax=Sulfurifustis variabilis TaxID=1675686 RepID=A0A1B4VDY5_9GAMM|nr:metalloregulator ArsR/SmtB family transcription factor [Sulfurifustis variabilis]BAU48777.1 ArsR family transcriptional regulator [Sulfurifustis variabilis]
MNAECARPLPDDWVGYPRFFAALGDTIRQQILLLFQTNEEICVNEITRLFELSRPAISHHLKVLRDANVLVSEKRGKEVYYRVNHAHCEQVLRAVQRRFGRADGSRRGPLPGLQAAG